MESLQCNAEAWDDHKEDKNSIPQCIGQSHITTAFSNMAPFPSRTHVMCQSITTGYIAPPPRATWGKFFERANPGPLGNFFRLISLSWGKNDDRIPGGGEKFSQTRRNCSLSLQKILKKTMRQYNFFYLEPGGGALECNLTGRCPFFKSLYNPFRKKLHFDTLFRNF